MKPYICLLLVLLICIASSGCGKAPSREAIYPRIISLAPSITETLFALGLEKNIVGITTCCDYPAETEKLEKVATFSNQANLERILSIKPDLIFSTGLEQAPLVEKLRALGLKVVLIYPQSLDKLTAGILEIGRLTNREKQASFLVNRMGERINKIKQRVKTIPDQKRPKVFVEICPDPLMTAGRGSFVDELIRLAGGKNIAADTARPYSQFSPKLVIKRNPDVIILGYMQPNQGEFIMQRMGWQDISAVKKRNIIADINPDLFLRPGPRIVDGLEQIHLKLFKER